MMPLHYDPLSHDSRPPQVVRCFYVVIAEPPYHKEPDGGVTVDVMPRWHPLSVKVCDRCGMVMRQTPCGQQCECLARQLFTDVKALDSELRSHLDSVGLELLSVVEVV